MRRKGGNRYKSRGRRACFYCSTSFDWDDPSSEFYPTWDHKTPKSKGGGKGQNLVLACRRCNQEKADMSAKDFIEYLTITRGCYSESQRRIRWAKHRGQFAFSNGAQQDATK